MTDLIRNFQKAKETSEKISNKMDHIRIETDKQCQKVKWFYQDKIYALEQERDRQVDILTTKSSKEIEYLKNEAEKSHQILNNVDRLFSFMKLFIEGFSVDEPEVYYYSELERRRIFVSPIATLKEDAYCKFRLYILPNRKPKNKFSLIIYGTAPLLGAKDPFRAKFKFNEKCNVSKEALVKYYQRNEARIKARLPTNLDELAADYEKAVKLFQDDAWKSLYLEDQKYYYEERVSRGVNSPEYRDIIKLIKHFKNPALLVGQLESGEGMNILCKLLNP
jgi:hypothetical protein